ncbi:hypothetical protein TcCL_NonESM04745 [Trypanosoma cruzi]|nr:hypothetical protein TcCL_NonESM04745 [Trypanosoma cruzi]
MSATSNAYWRTCSMRCKHTADQVGRHALHLVVLLQQTLTSSQSTAWVLREAAEWCHLCGRTKCAETTATLTPSHISTTFTVPHTHKGGVMGKRRPPHSACTRAHAIATPSTSHRKIVPCAQHTHGRNNRDRDASNSTALSFTSPLPSGLAPTLTVRHGAHSPLPSECTQQAGAQSPSCHRNGEQKQSSSRNIGASSGKEKNEACQQHSQQRNTQRDT